MLNDVLLLGNLTRDPDVKVVPLGDNKKTTVASFTVAVSRRFKKANGDWGESVTFVPCEAWDSGAERLGKVFSKGDGIIVKGVLKENSWTDKESGQKRSRLQVRVVSFQKFVRPSSPDKDTPVDDSTDSSEVNNVPQNAAEEIPF